MRTPLAIAGTTLRRLLRDRTSVFFMFALPAVVMLVIGTVAGGGRAMRIGYVGGGGAEAAAIRTALSRVADAEVRSFADVGEATTALRRAELEAVVVVPADADAAVVRGAQVQVGVVAGQAQTTRAAVEAVRAVVAERSARVQAARAHQAQRPVPWAGSVAAVDAVAASVPAIGVVTSTVDAESTYLPSGFGYSAPTMLVLFVFMTGATGGAAMIETRRLGIHARMLAGPVTTSGIVAGEALGYLLVTLLQSLVIVILGATVFGVAWGDPLAAAALVGAWSLVGTGTGMLSGTLFRTPEQATAIGTTTGMAAAMLGGCMWPLEIVPRALQLVADGVPHTWAIRGWVEVLSRGGGLVAVGRPLLVLLTFAAALLALASVRLQRRLAG